MPALRALGHVVQRIAAAELLGSLLWLAVFVMVVAVFVGCNRLVGLVIVDSLGLEGQRCRIGDGFLRG